MISDISDDFDLCFIQEHWLLGAQLDSLTFSSQFCSHGVSGMDDDSVLLGCPFGGCGIIYRKSLSAKVSPLPCHSKRFCAVSLSIDDKSFLCICVYLPTNYHDSQSHDEFLFALTEIEGFMHSVLFDHVIIAGDFNVDVHVPSPRALLFSSLLQIELWFV